MTPKQIRLFDKNRAQGNEKTRKWGNESGECFPKF